MNEVYTFTYHNREALTARLYDNGQVVLTDENGLRAMQFAYKGSNGGRWDLASLIDTEISSAMLAASLRDGASMTDAQAIEHIAELMSAEEWSCDTLDAIAETLRWAGRL